MKPFLLVVFGLTVICERGLCQEESFQLNSIFLNSKWSEGEHFGEYVEFLDQLSPDVNDPAEIPNKLSSQTWRSSTSNTVNFGVVTHAVWVRFAVTNPDSKNKTYVIEHDYPSDQINFYQFTDGDLIAQHELGYKVSANGDINFRNPSIRVEIQPGTSIFYVRIHHLGAVRFTARLWSYDAFLNHVLSDTIAVGIILGISALTVLYNLFFYLTLRTRAYLYNTIYVLFCLHYCSFFVGTSGQSGAFLKALAANSWIPTMFLMFTFLGLFTSRFLKLESAHRYVRLTFKVIIGMSVIGAVLGFVDALASFKLFQLIFVPCAVFFLVLASLKAAKGYRPAFFYLISFAFMLLGAIVESLVAQSTLSPDFSPWPFLVGYSMQSVFLSLAVGDQFNMRQKAARIKIEDLNVELQHNIDHINEIVEEQTRDIKSIMQHISLGIFTIIDSDFQIGKDTSLELKQILNQSEKEPVNAIELLFQGSNLDTDSIDRAKQAISFSLGQDAFVFETNCHCLPEEITVKQASQDVKIINIDWNPIVNDEDIITKILVVVRDVSKLHQLQISRHEQDELLQTIFELSSLSSDKSQRFLKVCRQRVQECWNLTERMADLDAESLKIIFINIHTLKGNARTYNLSKLAERLHQYEDYLSDLRSDSAAYDQSLLLQGLTSIRSLIDHYSFVNEAKLGRASENDKHLRVDFDKVELMISAIERQEQSPSLYRVKVGELLEFLRSEYYQTVSDVVTESFRDIDKIARDLGKPTPRVVLEIEKHYVDKSSEELLHNIFVHLIRNAIDHGIEPEEERRQNSKSVEGCIQVSIWVEPGELAIRFRDDGRGLNLSQIRRIAMDRGLFTSDTPATAREIAEMIFHPGFSTANSVTNISGRGVGMDAIRRYVESYQGSVSLVLLESSPAQKEAGFQAFEIIICLPEVRVLRSAA